VKKKRIQLLIITAIAMLSCVSCFSINVSSSISDNRYFGNEINIEKEDACLVTGYYIGDINIGNTQYHLLQSDRILISRDTSALFICLPKNPRGQAVNLDCDSLFNSGDIQLKNIAGTNFTEKITIFEASTRAVSPDSIVAITGEKYFYFSCMDSLNEYIAASRHFPIFMQENYKLEKVDVLFPEISDDCRYHYGIVNNAKLRYKVRSRSRKILASIAYPFAVVLDIATAPVQAILILIAASQFDLRP
jgi:hypothetical protein